MSVDIWKNGIYGLVVGDALGVPVEFTSRAARKRDPVVGMRGFGTHNQPAGTWSDDSSMVFAEMDSIAENKTIDYTDMMKRFENWYLKGAYTPFGELFDIGNATAGAVKRFGRGIKAEEAGGTEEWDNGNGSLMRILPICIYLYFNQKAVCTSEDENIYIIHNVSALTHGHLRSMIACGMHYFMVKAVIEQSGSLTERLQHGVNEGFRYYRRDMSNNMELINFGRLSDLSTFKTVPEDEIKSSGYVVDTLEAAIWCLVTSGSFKEAVLKAVNLGDDTDTVGAVTGGLAGLFYGFDEIPGEWVEAIQAKDMIEGLIERM